MEGSSGMRTEREGVAGGLGLLDKSVDTELDVSSWPSDFLSEGARTSTEEQQHSRVCLHTRSARSIPHKCHANVFMSHERELSAWPRYSPAMSERQREHEEFTAFQTKLISLGSGRSRARHRRAQAAKSLRRPGLEVSVQRGHFFRPLFS